jgi:hypothetical protein
MKMATETNQVSQQVEIQWPLEALFNYVSDITNNWEWQTNVIRSEWIDRTEDKTGSVFYEIRSEEGEEFYSEIQITEFIPDRRRTVKFNLDKPVLCSMHFIPLSEEETRLTIQLKWDFKEQPPVSFDLIRLKEILEKDLIADMQPSVVNSNS